MLEAIKREIGITGTYTGAGRTISSIYFGGGTPSLLDASEIQDLLLPIYEKFDVDMDAEITLEANPDDINPEKLEAWLDAGVNRLSLGVQTFQDEELTWMNRAHRAGEAIQAMKEIKQAGFTNYSADLIFGSPFQSDEALKKNLETLFSEGVPHISCYALTVEKHTALYHQTEKKGLFSMDPVKQAGQFLLLMDMMEATGYEHYEISNFAKPGMRSRHNSSYWLQHPAGIGVPYYGFGPSAHAYDGINTRKWNIANNALYIRALEQGSIPFESEILTPVQQLNEYIMTSLRSIEGINLALVKEHSGKHIFDALLKSGEKHIASGKLLLINQAFILSKEGRLFADGIAADLFFE